jgi:hypothetical protein
MAFDRLAFDPRSFLTEVPMTDRMSWTLTPTFFPEGTSAFHHYLARLGPHVSPELPAGTTFFDFPELPPGDYASSVDTVAVDGTVLASHAGPLYHVPSPVEIAVAMGIMVERVA